MCKVLMIAPGHNGLGGIVKVIEYYKSTPFWENEKITWIETHTTGSKIEKLVVLIKAIITFLKYAPKAKIAHIHSAGGVSSNRKYIFYCLSRIFSLKIVCHLHIPVLNFNGVVNYTFKKMVVNSDVVINLSPVFSSYLKQNIANRDYVNLNNPSTGFIEENHQKEKIILFAARLEKPKGYHDLLEALSKIDNLLGYKVTLAGSGEMEEAKEMILKKNIKNIELTGWLETNEMIQTFRKSDIFILPSYGEGFPISIIDALSNKCAVITTPVGGIPDFLENRVNCLYVKPGDIYAIKNAIEILINDEHLRKKLIENGFKLAVQEFNLQKITSKLSDIYQILLYQ